jgi:Spy/CpxP family protein refolding chaperone
VIDVLLLAARAPRAPQAKPAVDPATGAAASSPDDQTAQEQALAQVKAAFDYEMAQQAEMEREREALEALLLANLKDEDEVMKKWIAMIG